MGFTSETGLCLKLASDRFCLNNSWSSPRDAHLEHRLFRPPKPKYNADLASRRRAINSLHSKQRRGAAGVVLCTYLSKLMAFWRLHWSREANTQGPRRSSTKAGSKTREGRGNEVEDFIFFETDGGHTPPRLLPIFGKTFDLGRRIRKNQPPM